MRIDRNWPGYRTKSEFVLKCIADDCHGLQEWKGYDPFPIPRDGDWCQLGRAYNVGASLLLWMVENGLLERRHGHGKSLDALLRDWYRPPGDPAEVDLGDWWIE